MAERHRDRPDTAAIVAHGTGCLEDYAEEIPTHREWLTLEQFDRRRANRRLRQYASGDRQWLFAQELG